MLGPFPETGLLMPINYAQLALVHWPSLLTHAASAATAIFVSLMALLLNATGLEWCEAHMLAGSEYRPLKSG